MKIGTDSVLLGCFCEAGKAKRILDIGTGTGLLALMMAQKSDAHIDAVELDAAAAAEAQENFECSPWRNRVHIHHQKIQDFVPLATYDLVISNPPYFRHKHQFSIADEQRSRARHDRDLTPEELISATIRLMSDEGNAWFILPVHEASILKQIGKQSGLYVHLSVYIHPKINHLANREIMCFGKSKRTVSEQHFNIYDQQGMPTDAYRTLTSAFYLWKESDDDDRLKW